LLLHAFESTVAVSRPVELKGAGGARDGLVVQGHIHVLGHLVIVKFNKSVPYTKRSL
jgi:hypothetical protein